MLPPPRPSPRKQRRHDAVTRIQPRREIRHRDAYLDRFPVAAAGDVHQPELGLDHDVVARAVRVGPRLAVARDGGVDEARVDGAEGVVVHFILFEGAGEVVLYEDVALRDELVEDLCAGWVLEVEA